MKQNSSLHALYSLTKEQVAILSRYYPLWASSLISGIEFAKKLSVNYTCFEKVINDYDSIV
jgi:hypothetical protein